jgi:hypothetical protein
MTFTEIVDTLLPLLTLLAWGALIVCIIRQNDE